MTSLKTYFIILLSCLCCSQIFAQDNDTSVFFRYASTFENLIPSPYYPADRYIPDTTSLLMFNAGPRSKSLLKQIERTTYGYDREITEGLGGYKYVWDGEGRVVGYQEFWPGDTSAHLNVRFRFLVRQSMSEVYVTNGNNLDTTVFQYNRSGWVGTWKHHAVHVDSNYVINGTRMYDSRGQLIVATNIVYGPLKGSYTFEYDREGRLIRRTFLAGSTGVVLCTDTLIYEYATEARLIVTITHKLKVAGMEKWALLEKQTVFSQSRRVISYSDYNDADTSYLYRNLPEYTISYEYDDKSRVTSESFGTDIMPDMITAKYFYSKQHQADSVVYSERVVEKKAAFTRVYSRDVREYDEKGYISMRTITTYLFEEKKKKDKVVPTEVVRISYVWK